MDQDPKLAEKITADIVSRLERSKTAIPVGVSNRHVHLSQEDWDTLFGKGTEPRKFRQVKQPGFTPATRPSTSRGPRGAWTTSGSSPRTGPAPQVEVSQTDARILGLKPPIRDSGKLDGSPGVRVVGPKGTLEIKQGLIIARRHIHAHPLEAQAMGLKDGEIVRVRAGIGGLRELVYEQVLVRVSDKFSLELHVDTDEANAAWIRPGTTST